jgi:hypothetical protein
MGFTGASVMAFSALLSRRSLPIICSLMCLTAGLAFGQEKAAPALDKQSQSAAIAVGQLCTQRPEGVIVAAMIATKREGGVVGPMEFMGLEPPVQGAVAGASMVGTAHPLTAIALLRHGRNNGYFAGDQPMPVKRVRSAQLDRELLVGIEDSKPIPKPNENPDEYKSYLYVISYCQDVPLGDMKAAVKPEITFTHLIEDPSRYRGAVVGIKGKLKQVKMWAPPASLRNDGIKNFYEGVILADNGGWYWVGFTELPSSIKVGDNLDYPVECYGYFFKRTYLQNSKQVRIKAPLVVARTITLEEPPGAASLEGGAGVLAGTPIGVVLSSLVVVGALIAVLVLVMRRGDVAVRTRLKEARAPQWVDPSHGSTAPSGESKPAG